MDMKLKEIIWEITSKCDKGCKYCGSKNFLNDKAEDYANTIKIANMIAEYPPETINISGGESGCMDADVLNQCLDILYNAKIDLKIITNGSVFNQNVVFGHISVIGLSINTIDDIKYAEENYSKQLEQYKDKIVVVTNFGKHNIWDFNAISDFAKKVAGWQVQLTAGNNLNLPKQGIQQLWEQLDECGTNYILADDLQAKHACQAGIQGCGITYDGYVMPCLSMRSWAKSDDDIWDDKEKYNLFTYRTDHCSPLKEVWETQFRHRRFCDKCKCCRDDFEYPKETKKDLSKRIFDELKNFDINKLTKKTKSPVPGTIMLYGATIPTLPKTNLFDETKVTNFRYGINLPNKS